MESKKKKKKNKKKQANVDEDMEFLDKITKQVEIEQAVTLKSAKNSVLKMDKKFFNYKREMKQLFADTASQFGAVGREKENAREERKQSLNAEMEH